MSQLQIFAAESGCDIPTEDTRTIDERQVDVLKKRQAEETARNIHHEISKQAVPDELDYFTLKEKPKRSRKARTLGEREGKGEKKQPRRPKPPFKLKSNHHVCE